MSALAVVHDTLTLNDLAARANAEYELARRHAENAVVHAIRCGEALLDAQAQVPKGEWLRWLRENVQVAPTTAYRHMRLARNQNLVLEAGHTTSEGALEAIAGEPWHGRKRLSSSEKREILRLARDDGMSLEEIAQTFGVAVSTAWYWINDKNRKKSLKGQEGARARRRAAEQALVREENFKAVKKAGGASAEAYSLIRRAAQMIDRARDEMDDRDARIALARAIGHLHRAEDDVVRALGITHGASDPSGQEQGPA